MGRYVLYGTSFFVSGETKNLFSFAKSWWQVDRINPIKLYDDNKSISGFNLRHLLFQQGQHEYVARKVQTVFELFKASKISPVIDSVWAFEDIAEAMQKMHDRRNLGKLLLDPAQAPKPRPAEPEKPVKVGRKVRDPPIILTYLVLQKSCVLWLPISVFVIWPAILRETLVHRVQFDCISIVRSCLALFRV